MCWLRFVRRPDTGASIGAVQALWRYPVKSMLGERCERLDVDTRGVVGDRHYAVRSAEGKIASGKNTRRFRAVDGMFRLRAMYRDGVAEIVFPDGWVMRADDAAVDAALTSWLGQPASLAREAEVSHFDQQAIHVVTTAGLSWLKAQLPGSAIDERRFRANLCLEVPGATPIEQNWDGKFLNVGPRLRLHVTGPTERCRMVALAQAELPHDPSVLDYIARNADLQFGVYAEVITPGAVRRGDRVILADG